MTDSERQKAFEEALFLLVACRQIFVGVRNGRTVPVETAERHIRTIDEFREKTKEADHA